MMTEKQWLKSGDPNEMLVHLGKNADDRKYRLYLVACARRLQHLLLDPAHVEAIEIAEKYADRQASDKLRQRMRTQLHTKFPEAAPLSIRNTYGLLMHLQEKTSNAGAICRDSAYILARQASEKGDSPDKAVYRSVLVRELKRDATYFRDIFGNPFRPVAFDPDWRTSTAVALARIAYDSREFGDLPVLADALQDAGCDSEPVLAHLRGPGPHVRGCWAVDLVLGRG